MAGPHAAAAGGREAQLLARLLNDQIAILLGSRIAEEITMDSLTTGAGTTPSAPPELSRKMVCEWGHERRDGTRSPSARRKKPRSSRHPRSPSTRTGEDTALKIDQEVKALITDNYQRAHHLLWRQGQAAADGRALLARGSRRRPGQAACRRRTADDPKPVAARSAVEEDEPRPRPKERAPNRPRAERRCRRGRIRSGIWNWNARVCRTH